MVDQPNQACFCVCLVQGEKVSCFDAMWRSCSEVDFAGMAALASLKGRAESVDRRSQPVLMRCWDAVVERPHASGCEQRLGA